MSFRLQAKIIAIGLVAPTHVAADERGETEIIVTAAEMDDRIRPPVSSPTRPY